jgi:hypothetical protein
MKKTRIQKKILKILNERSECALGDIVEELDHTYGEVLENVIELKKKGKIVKPLSHKGYFAIKK